MFKPIIALLVISVWTVNGTYTDDQTQEDYSVGNKGPPNTYTYEVNQIAVEDATLDFSQLVTKYKYTCETHKVSTSDGYRLTMFRLRNEKKCDTFKKIPIVIMHGLFDSSDTWVMSGPKSGLAYNLADNCYDIWLPNARGNRYSKEHNSLNPDQQDFWQFSFDQIGYFDVPASIDYVCNYTNQNEVNYIGHSQGTASFFIMTSSKPEYNDRINVAVCLAPIAWLYHSSNPIMSLFLDMAKGLFEYLVKVIGNSSIFTRGTIPDALLEAACQYSPFAVCDTMLEITCGQNTTDLSEHALQTIFGHYPCGTSIQNIFHYVQGLEKDVFRHFDYGEQQNLDVYGTADPPDYDVSKITTKVALFSGLHDKLSTLPDVETLKKHMRDDVIIDHYLVPEPTWGHNDFVWGESVPQVITPRILEHLAKYGGYDDDCDD